MEIRIGDTVRFLNDVGGGTVERIAGGMAYVTDSDGFATPMLLRECVVVARAGEHQAKTPSFYAPTPIAVASKAEQPRKETPAAAPKAEPELPFVETPEGERLNVVLAFEPRNIHAISTTDFDAYLINDSNYYLSFTFMTCADDDRGWTLRRAATVEAGTELHLAEITRDDLPAMDRLAMQIIAYKPSKPFEAKEPISIDIPLDTTKFAKLHAFHSNAYFDSPVIALELVTNDVPRSRQPQVDARALAQAVGATATPLRPKGPRTSKPAERPDRSEPIVVDLHIDQLVDSIAGLSNADMLNLQVDTFRRTMDANLRRPGQRIIFIHGKGNGVLRQALMKELNHRYRGHDTQDASFERYGFGATQVTIRNTRR